MRDRGALDANAAVGLLHYDSKNDSFIDATVLGAGLDSSVHGVSLEVMGACDTHPAATNIHSILVDGPPIQIGAVSGDLEVVKGWE